jgi:hypothetical protein
MHERAWPSTTISCACAPRRGRASSAAPAMKSATSVITASPRRRAGSRSARSPRTPQPGRGARALHDLHAAVILPTLQSEPTVSTTRALTSRTRIAATDRGHAPEVDERTPVRPCAQFPIVRQERWSPPTRRAPAVERLSRTGATPPAAVRPPERSRPAARRARVPRPASGDNGHGTASRERPARSSWRASCRSAAAPGA